MTRVARVLVKFPEYWERRELRRARIASGYTSLRVSRHTRELLDDFIRDGWIENVSSSDASADEALALLLARALGRPPAP